MDGHELAVVLTAVHHEEHALLGDVTCRTDECVVLEATDSRWPGLQAQCGPGALSVLTTLRYGE